MTSKTWAVCGALVAVLGLGVVGNSAGAAGSSAGHPSGADVRPAASPLTTVGFQFQVTVDGLGTGPVTVAGSGRADLPDGSASLTATLPGALAALLPGGVSTPETVRAVLTNGTVYLDVPSLASLVGKPWISVALPGRATAAIPGISSDSSSALGDVDAVVAFAAGHGAIVTSLGTHRVSGVRATGSQIVASVGDATEGASVTAGLWANSSGDLVQATVSAQGTGSAATYGVSGSVDLRKYGAPVTISVPNSSKVVPVPFSLLENVLGQHLHLPGAT